MDVAAYEYTDICNIKQGFIAMLTNLNLPVEHKSVRGTVLHAQQAFVVLNKDSLSVFENQNANSLIKTVNLKTIDVPKKPLIWNNFHCFQLSPKADFNRLP